MSKLKGILLDLDYKSIEDNSVIRLYFKTENKKIMLYDNKFKPYFYAIPKTDAEKAIKEIKTIKEYDLIHSMKTEEKKLFNGEKTNAIKIILNQTAEIRNLREKISELNEVKEVREANIPFTKRYLIDKQLTPMSVYEIEFKENELINLKSVENEKINVKLTAFDIETLSPGRFSDPTKDKIIMSSIASKKEAKIYSEKKINKGFAVKVSNEKELIENTVKDINNADILTTYNGDSFDLPYIKERIKQLSMNTGIGFNNEGIKIRKMGQDNGSIITGIIHLDAYKMLRLLNRFGAVNLIKFDLESVSKRLFGKEKEKVKAEEINDIWFTGKNLERLAEYNLEDSKTTYKIAETYLPLMIELTKLIKLPLFDVSRSSASLLIEYLLINESFKRNTLIPANPPEQVIRHRMLQSFEGGYVQEPRTGLHENIAILDFSSLHPTIMISHNISPDTLNCEHKECKEKNTAPTGDYFCMKKKGFLSGIIEKIFNKRIKLKRKLKLLNPESKEFKMINARQHSLKIILNSFYGTLGYARFKWYSRECAAAVTAFSREYVKWVAKKAEKAGFVNLYSDTDSAFLKIPLEKTKEDVKKFVEKINSELPKAMNLDLEGFYKRGIFVTKKEGGAAKKRYALIDYNDNLKIVGFEYVRRDWAPIAKDTQRKVIEAVLKEGKPEKAIQIVKQTIKKLKERKVRKKDLIILTQIKKPLDKYESIGPHVAAAMKARKRGKQIGINSVLGYIITRTGKSISDRAEIAEFVKEKDYDANYYIKHQIIPAVIKIMQEFDLNEEDLIQGGKQKTLGSF